MNPIFAKTSIEDLMLALTTIRVGVIDHTVANDEDDLLNKTYRFLREELKPLLRVVSDIDEELQAAKEECR